MFFPCNARPSHIESWGLVCHWQGRAGVSGSVEPPLRSMLLEQTVSQGSRAHKHPPPSVTLQSLQSLKMSLPLGGVGGVKREDAVKFLERVQQRLNSRPQDYADFLNIMKVGNLSIFSPILMKVFRNCNQKVFQWKVRSKKSRIFSRYTISVIVKL